MRLQLLSLLSYVVASSCSPSKSRSNSDSLVVNLGYAQFQGVFDVNTNVTNFLGLRYAAPPTGDLRFRAPQPPAQTSGVQVADTEPPECVQGLPTDSEDCLFVSVAIPGDTISPEASFPVVFWIHGGGYVGGNEASFFGSDLLQEANNEVISVVIQYRLGMFGFLSGTDVKNNGDLNAGLLDQHFALRWVNEHISKFGGDPQKVTIWGESAGAGSVLQHVVAQDGQTSPPLFRAAITSSTFLPSQYAFDDPIPEGIYESVLSQTNCSSTSDPLACLRATDVTVLSAVSVNINAAAFFGTFGWAPVVDGTFITQRPTVSLNEGKINGQAFLAITNTHEGVDFVDQTGVVMNTSTYAGELFPRFGPEQTDQVQKLYVGVGDSILDEIDAIMGDSIFKCPSYYLLDAFHQRNFNAFKGEFAIPPALHGMDVGFYFPHLTDKLVFPNASFSAAFSQSFLSFVISLDPNDKLDPTEDITPAWQMFNNGDIEMIFNTTANGAANVQPIVRDEAFLERCSFWNSVAELTAQ